MKQPRYTDSARYPHGYTPSDKTDIRETFRRATEPQGEFAEWVEAARELDEQQQ